MKAFTPENVATIANRPGNYYFYSERRALIYAGLSSILRHRLQSYYQKDDLRVHRTKRALRPRIAFFAVRYRAISRARKVELRVKKKARYNFK